MGNNFIEAVSIDWSAVAEGSYLHGIEALRSFDELRFERRVTYFVGENATGKSTLLEAIAVAYGFNPEGGTFNYRFSTYDDVCPLADAVHLKRGWARPKSGYFFRAESFFNVATASLRYESTYGGKALHAQSHGEGFLAFFQTFEGEGIYLMDEPEAALSPQRQLTLLAQIAAMAKGGAQFIIASHSPILLGIPDAQILSFDDGHVHECAYEDTQGYQVTELFVNHRASLLRQLLE